METQLVGHLPLSLPHYATKTHVFPDLQNASLLSVGQLCDYGCQAVLNKNSLRVLNSNKNILTGEHNNSYGLWDTPLTPTTLPATLANAIFQMNKTKQ